MEQHYYKFRSLQNLRFFTDIILNKRLYASRYDELNDPMEGAYITDITHKNTIRLLREKKYKTRICSLTKDYKHTLLWTHYADGHKGCCLEVSAQNKRLEPVEIQYVNTLPNIQGECEGAELLSHKSILWNYENEVRFFRKSSYLNVTIHQVIFGIKVSKKDLNYYTKLIQIINPSINVRRIERSEIINGFM